MRTVFHDADLQSSFTHTGYVHVPMLSAAEIALIHERLALLRPDDGFAPDTFGLKYHCSFLDNNLAYKRATFALIKAVFDPHIARYLKGYRVLNCNFYVKPPGTGEFPVHQNWPAIADLNDTTVTVWCPLQDVVRENGALQFVPGSHKLLPHVEGPGTPAFFDTFRTELIQKYLQPQPMSAGSAMIFDDALIHWSANNESAFPRVAIQILCVPNDAQPVYFFRNPEEPDRFELIAVDCDFYIEQGIREITRRQPEWRSLGFVQNTNRLLTEAEFANLLSGAGEFHQQESYVGQAC